MLPIVFVCVSIINANVKKKKEMLFDLNYICVILKCLSMDMGIYTTIQKFEIGKFFWYFFLKTSLRSHAHYVHMYGHVYIIMYT